MSDLLTGIRRQGPLVNLPAPGGAATAAAIMAISAFAGMQGVKNMRIRRLKIRNNAAGNIFVHIGLGVGAGVDAMPPLYSITNTTDDYAEGDLPGVSFTATIVAWPDAIAGGSVDVQIEVEEQG